jgi:hypothetical protein
MNALWGYICGVGRAATLVMANTFNAGKIRGILADLATANTQNSLRLADLNAHCRAYIEGDREMFLSFTTLSKQCKVLEVANNMLTARNSQLEGEVRRLREHLH